MLRQSEKQCRTVKGMRRLPSDASIPVNGYFRKSQQAHYPPPFAGMVTIGPIPLIPMSEIENNSMTAAKTLFDRMSVSAIQNQRPSYWTAIDGSGGMLVPLIMFKSAGA